jgi:ribosomal protein S4
MPPKKKPDTELRAKLKEKIALQRITRSTKEQKEHTLDRTLKRMGIDKDKLKADLEAVKKQGGLSIRADGGHP